MIKLYFFKKNWGAVKLLNYKKNDSSDAAN